MIPKRLPAVSLVLLLGQAAWCTEPAAKPLAPMDRCGDLLPDGAGRPAGDGAVAARDRQLAGL
jgi:hypothetical protein